MTTQANSLALDGKVLGLVAALSDPSNHDVHVQAIRARDEALAASVESYGDLCVQLALLMHTCGGAGSSSSSTNLLATLNSAQLPNSTTVKKLQEGHVATWIHFGQLTGFVLKQALLSPPMNNHHQVMRLVPPYCDSIQEILLSCLSFPSPDIRGVVSSIIATTAVSHDDVQPSFKIPTWPQLIPTLLANLRDADMEKQHGSLMTIRKMMEDGPDEIPLAELDLVVPILLEYLKSPLEPQKVDALQALVSCCDYGILPNALVSKFDDYLGALSQLAMDPSTVVKKWVCRSIVTLLVLRTEYIQPHMDAICAFMLSSTMGKTQQDVAMEACEFWLTFTTLQDDGLTPAMIATVEGLLPQLIPALLSNMVYSSEQQDDLLLQNEMELQQLQPKQEQKPLFHKSKSKHAKQEEDDSDDDDGFDDDDDNEWSLRKCSAASLDSLATMYGPQCILPPFLPALKEGLSHGDPWVQEAAVLALGAVADGCRNEMYPHMNQLFPMLLQLLSEPESKPNHDAAATSLPQLKSSAAWTMGRYASWAVAQVHSGQEGQHLLATMVEVLMARLQDANRRVQVSCCSAFGVLVESAGDLLVPYLEPIYQHLVSAMSRYQSRSLLIVFDTMAVMADFIGPAIGEGNLTAIYIPPLLSVWNNVATHAGPTDRTLLPLMESLASIALICGVNYQPYALETFEMAMSIIEAVTLMLTSSQDDEYFDDQEADPIVCSSDLLDGLVEGLGSNFATLVSSSTRYGQHFVTVLHALVSHEVASVRMSAFALMGDLAVNCPVVLEPALPQLLSEAVNNLNGMHLGVTNNAVWAIGEVCVRCGDNPKPLEPFVPSLVQLMIGLLMGNAGPDGVGGGLVGVAENTAATMGRLAKVNPNFVAPDLPRFLVGWCDGIAKVTDPKERHDAFEGFVLALHANPQAIQTASPNICDTVSAILFAIVSWHLPMDGGDVLHNAQFAFEPFPPQETELQQSLGKLMHDLKNSLQGPEHGNAWNAVYNQIPVNVRRLLHETYQL